MTGDRHDREDARREKALKDLEDAAAGSEVFGTSAFVRQAEKARAHFSGADAETDDWTEVWGRRIGRGLSLIAFFGLLIYLSVTYL
ncbi:hypothetical protein [Microbaculum marinisediminis]|uniref:Uncharacterized protein n=1 Tax=Microbaculum marinisediminis TaxID=2931392 RepID=A0AAW5QWH4_9HYPH|nr:hypothetical protein [Microbaculum sp. A6E488]MCT8972272.1 hypothetical protein [Microbaculum sp. A6E488]